MYRKICMKIVDLKNKKFGKLQVIKKTTKIQNGKSIWLCKCDCGKTIKTTTGNLTSGNTKSCGCLQKDVKRKTRTTYEYRNKPIYTLWAGMVRRCHGKDQRNSKWYKRKGIVVCDEWRTALNFIKWALNNGYKDGYTIHRKDNEGDYCPSNCIFITQEKHYEIHTKIRKIPLSNNTTGFVGVSYNKKHNFYAAYINHNKKRKHLGCFKTAEEAHNKRKQYIKENNI